MVDFDRHLKMKDRASEGLIVLHSNKAISLTWPEIEKLKKDVSDKVPGIFSQYGKVKNCLYFNPDSKQYSGCSAF